jgi:hypothetical protein
VVRDPRDGLLRHTESLRNRHLRHPAASRQSLDRDHVPFAKGRVSVLLATLTILPTTPTVCPVASVVALRPGIEMCRVAARRVVARVEHVQTFWDRPFSKLEDDPRGAQGSPRADKLAVALHESGTSPRPALVGATYIDLLPRLLCERALRASVLEIRLSSPSIVTASRGTELALGPVGSGDTVGRREDGSALLAGLGSMHLHIIQAHSRLIPPR